MGEKIKIILITIMFIAVVSVVSIVVRENSQKVSNIEVQASAIEANEQNFEQEVLKSDKKVLIDFYATWCEPCKMLEPVIEEIAEENNNIKIVRVDVDKCEELADKYNISAMPTLVVIEDGNEINRSVGVIPKEKIIELCEK